MLLRNRWNGHRRAAGVEDLRASGEDWWQLLSQVARDGEANRGPSLEPLARCGLAGINATGDDAGVHADFLSLRRNARFWDYAQPDVMSRDAQDMRTYESLEPAPVPDPAPAGERSVADGGVDQRVLHIARTVFTCQATVAFHDQRVERRTVPSIGARHGLTCHVLTPAAQDRPARCFQVGSHGELMASSWTVRPVTAPWPSILVGVRFEHYQWRYRTGWIYPCIYLDLGHVVGAIRGLAAQAGIRWRARKACRAATGGFPGLVAEPLLEIRFYLPKEVRHA
jgi:hypothetical protein